MGLKLVNLDVPTVTEQLPDQAGVLMKNDSQIQGLVRSLFRFSLFQLGAFQVRG